MAEAPGRCFEFSSDSAVFLSKIKCDHYTNQKISVIIIINNFYNKEKSFYYKHSVMKNRVGNWNWIQNWPNQNPICGVSAFCLRRIRYD